METNRLSEEELEHIDGGSMVPSSSGAVLTRDEVVFRYEKDSYVTFKSKNTNGYLKGKIVAQVYYGYSGYIYPAYIIENPLTRQREQIMQSQIYTEV